MWPAIQNSITQFLVGIAPGDMNAFQAILYLINRYGPSYINGAKCTLIVSLVSTLIGCIIGMLVGILQTIPVSKKDSGVKRFFVGLLRIYVEIFRGTPMMIQAVFIFFGAAFLFDVTLNPWLAAVVIVSINTGAYMAETVRGGILSIDSGQTEGAKALGMTHVQTMLSVILPQTLRNIMPQIGNNLIINVKDTCVLSVISIAELFYAHKGAAGATYMYFPSAIITMIIYLTMTVVLSLLLRLMEKKMDGNDSYDLATTDTLAHTTGMYNYPVRGSNFDERSVEHGTVPQGEKQEGGERDV